MADPARSSQQLSKRSCSSRNDIRSFRSAVALGLVLLRVEPRDGKPERPFEYIGCPLVFCVTQDSGVGYARRICIGGCDYASVTARTVRSNGRLACKGTAGRLVWYLIQFVGRRGVACGPLSRAGQVQWKLGACWKWDVLWAYYNSLPGPQGRGRICQIRWDALCPSLEDEVATIFATALKTKIPNPLNCNDLGITGCGQGRIRTADTRLFRPLLYHLSYLTICYNSRTYLGAFGIVPSRTMHSIFQ